MGQAERWWERHRAVNCAPTRAELDVLRCFAAGMTGPQAAAHLGRTHYTVKGQCKTARRHLMARNTTHAVALAIRAGYIA